MSENGDNPADLTDKEIKTKPSIFGMNMRELARHVNGMSQDTEDPSPLELEENNLTFSEDDEPFARTPSKTVASTEQSPSKEMTQDDFIDDSLYAMNSFTDKDRDEANKYYELMEQLELEKKKENESAKEMEKLALEKKKKEEDSIVEKNEDIMREELQNGDKFTFLAPCLAELNVFSFANSTLPTEKVVPEKQLTDAGCQTRAVDIRYPEMSKSVGIDVKPSNGVAATQTLRIVKIHVKQQTDVVKEPPKIMSTSQTQTYSTARTIETQTDCQTEAPKADSPRCCPCSKQQAYDMSQPPYYPYSLVPFRCPPAYSYPYAPQNMPPNMPTGALMPFVTNNTMRSSPMANQFGPPLVGRNRVSEAQINTESQQQPQPVPNQSNSFLTPNNSRVIPPQMYPTPQTPDMHFNENPYASSSSLNQTAQGFLTGMQAFMNNQMMPPAPEPLNMQQMMNVVQQSGLLNALSGVGNPPGYDINAVHRSNHHVTPVREDTDERNTATIGDNEEENINIEHDEEDVPEIQPPPKRRPSIVRFSSPAVSRDNSVNRESVRAKPTGRSKKAVPEVAPKNSKKSVQEATPKKAVQEVAPNKATKAATPESSPIRMSVASYHKKQQDELAEQKKKKEENNNKPRVRKRNISKEVSSSGDNELPQQTAVKKSKKVSKEVEKLNSNLSEGLINAKSSRKQRATPSKKQ